MPKKNGKTKSLPKAKKRIKRTNLLIKKKKKTLKPKKMT